MNLIEIKKQINPDFIKENPSILDVYNPEEKKIVFSLSQLIPETFSKELKEFIEGRVVSEEDVLSLIPLISKINEIQQFKYIKYENKLEDKIVKRLENDFNATLTYNEEDGIYTYSLQNQDDLESFEKEFNKAIKSQHDFSYQDYKDANKTIGSLNSSLRDTKKTIKDPYLSVCKKIDSIFNAFSTESDNARNSLQVNFQKALEYEANKKEEAARKKKEAELKQIEELQSQNEEIQQKLENENKLRYKQEQITLFNSLLKTVTTNLIEILPKLNDEAVRDLTENKMFNEYSFPEVIKRINVEVLSEEEVNSLASGYAEERGVWFSIIERQTRLIESNKKIEELEKQQPVQSNPSTDEPLNIPENDSEKLQVFVSLLKNLKTVDKDLDSINFQNPYYAQLKSVIMTDSLPKLFSIIDKITDWLEQKEKDFLTSKPDINEN